jgi:hypothetical protein
MPRPLVKTSKSGEQSAHSCFASSADRMKKHAWKKQEKFPSPNAGYGRAVGLSAVSRIPLPAFQASSFEAPLQVGLSAIVGDLNHMLTN